MTNPIPEPTRTDPRFAMTQTGDRLHVVDRPKTPTGYYLARCGRLTIRLVEGYPRAAASAVCATCAATW